MTTQPAPKKTLNSESHMGFPKQKQHMCFCTSLHVDRKHIPYGSFSENIVSMHMDFPRLPQCVFFFTDPAVNPYCVAVINVSHKSNYAESCANY